MTMLRSNDSHLMMPMAAGGKLASRAHLHFRGRLVPGLDRKENATATD